MHFPLSCFFSQSSKKMLFSALQMKKWHEQGPEKPSVVFKLDCRTSVLFQEGIKLLTSLLVQRSWNRRGFAPSHWTFYRIFFSLRWQWPCLELQQILGAEQHREVQRRGVLCHVPGWTVTELLDSTLWSVNEHCRAHAGPCTWHSTPDPKREGFLSTRSCSSTGKEQLLAFILGFFTQCELTSIAFTLCGFSMHQST